MPTTNYAAAAQFQENAPHTFNAFQKLVMAMASYVKLKDKKTFFGRDRGLEAYKTFEVALRNTCQSLIVDGLVQQDWTADAVRGLIVDALVEWETIFPNWQDAYGFAGSYFIRQPQAANAHISTLGGFANS